VAVRIAHREGLLGGLGVPEQEHLHGASVSQPGERATSRAGDTDAAARAVASATLVIAVDEAILSMMQVFSLRRDGVAIDGNAFARRQADRTDAIFAWLGQAPWAGELGLAQLSAICALDWMEFRSA
jgi:hypothetical protein